MESQDTQGRSPRRIRCPRCGWSPGARETWLCTCLHSWNTFDTGGLCPACGKQWSETQCPRCATWSPHARWYEQPDEPDEREDPS